MSHFFYVMMMGEL